MFSLIFFLKQILHVVTVNGTNTFYLQSTVTCLTTGQTEMSSNSIVVPRWTGDDWARSKFSRFQGPGSVGVLKSLTTVTYIQIKVRISALPVLIVLRVVILKQGI